MTTDLEGYLAASARLGTHNPPELLRIAKELARRLEEAQQKIAEAKAEALDEAATVFASCAMQYSADVLNSMAAEYRAKARGE